MVTASNTELRTAQDALVAYAAAGEPLDIDRLTDAFYIMGTPDRTVARSWAIATLDRDREERSEVDEWDAHLNGHSFADGTADTQVCVYCRQQVTDGSWTDAYVR